jgi:hypothetical protein
VSLVRVGGQLVDDARTCVVPDCGAHAAAESYQVELPAQADELRRRAEAFERLAKEARAEAEAIGAEIETAQPRAFICGGHRDRLPKVLVGPWAPVGAWYLGLPQGGRLSAEPGSQAEAETIARTVAALDSNPPQYREPASAGV